jgi:hypothetical protein
MDTFSPLDLIRAHPWSHSFFTTYALSLSFFEAVVLDALVRQNVERTLILADIDGVRTAVAEYGSRCAGRVYEVEPVAVDHGCFHPKLMALTSATEAHLVVGSGNLTFGGWGSNLECVEHLHPGVAGDAFDDAADFLESLASAPGIKHHVQEPCSALAEELRQFASAGDRSGNIRLLHSLDRSILEQLGQFSEELGGAERLTVASPFHDGTALDRLCSQLGVDHAYVHSHAAGTVAGSFGSNWPGGTKARPVTIASFAGDPRRLHAKAFEIICRKGRIVLSGSANATLAALGYGHNVELCVARMQRNPVVGWLAAPSSAPPSSALAPTEETEHKEEGVLRAILEGDVLNGWILTPFPAGSAAVSRVTASSCIHVGETLVTGEGKFTMTGRDIEREAWTARRLILKVTSASGATASGFVSFSAFAEIKRHLGGVSSRLLAVLGGTETPDDVAAVIIWFSEHPEYLSAPSGGGGGPHHPAPAQGEVSVSTLLNPNGFEMTHSYPGDTSGTESWRRFVDLILACFRQPRGPIGAEDESEEGGPDDDGAGQDASKRPRVEPKRERQFNFLEKLLDDMLGGSSAQRSHAFWLAHFVCDRVEPDPVQVKSYLYRLMSAFVDEPPLAADREATAAAVLVWSTDLPSRDDLLRVPRVVRRRLLRMGATVDGPMPDMQLVQGFTRALAPNVDFVDLWDKIRSVRTAQEEIKSFRLAGAGASLGPEFPFLIGTQELSKITASEHKQLMFMTRFDPFCPHCHLALPLGQASRLREVGVARALNCCGHIVLCEEI